MRWIVETRHLICLCFQIIYFSCTLTVGSRCFDMSFFETVIKQEVYPTGSDQRAGIKPMVLSPGRVLDCQAYHQYPRSAVLILNLMGDPRLRVMGCWNGLMCSAARTGYSS